MNAHYNTVPTEFTFISSRLKVLCILRSRVTSFVSRSSSLRFVMLMIKPSLQNLCAFVEYSQRTENHSEFNSTQQNNMWGLALLWLDRFRTNPSRTMCFRVNRVNLLGSGKTARRLTGEKTPNIKWNWIEMHIFQRVRFIWFWQPAAVAASATGWEGAELMGRRAWRTQASRLNGAVSSECLSALSNLILCGNDLKWERESAGKDAARWWETEKEPVLATQQFKF